MVEKFKRLCEWLDSNKKGLFLVGLVMFYLCVISMTVSILCIIWMITLFPKEYGSAPLQITFAGVGTLVTAAGGLYTLYNRIADSERNKTLRYDLDSKYNSVQGMMPDEVIKR